jgi:hypothetical protein
MPIDDLADIVLKALRDHQAHNIDDVVRKAAQEASSYPADVRSVVLGLLRRDKLKLTDDFKVKLP